MLVARLLRHDRVPQDALRRLRDRAAEEVGKRHAGARDDRHFLVAEKHDVAGVAEDGGDVGGDEELASAEADDDRRAFPHRDDLFRIVCRNQDQREQPAHLHQRAADRVLEAVAPHLALDQVRDDLGVGLGDEAVPLRLQLVLQIEVVLDDAVVDDDDLAGAVAMRMGVLLGRTSVRRPAGVADAVITGDRIGADNLFQVRQFAGAAAQIDRAVADHGDSRRVVAAIFEPPQAVDENRHDVLRSDVADNSTHRVSSRVWLWALGSGLSALGSRLWALGSGLSALGSRLWALGFGPSALGSRLWAFMKTLGSTAFARQKARARRPGPAGFEQSPETRRPKGESRKPPV